MVLKLINYHRPLPFLTFGDDIIVPINRSVFLANITFFVKPPLYRRALGFVAQLPIKRLTSA